jgi:hypothetical protein
MLVGAVEPRDVRFQEKPTSVWRVPLGEFINELGYRLTGARDCSMEGFRQEAGEE